MQASHQWRSQIGKYVFSLCSREKNFIMMVDESTNGRCNRESNWSENFLTGTSFWTRTFTHIHVVETYWFLLERIGEITSASVHLLLKGAVPVGVSPGEQPVYNQNVFNNKQNDIIKSAVDFGLVEKQKLFITILL